MAAYNMAELTSRTQAKTLVITEGNFLLGKIDWAMTGATGATVSGSSLTITRDTAPSSVVFDLTGATNLQIKRGGNSAVVLNSTNIKVQNLVFTHTGAGNGPEFVTAAFDLSTNTADGKMLAQNFVTTKYLRK